MERKWFVFIVVFFLFPLMAEAEHKDYDNQIWTDIESEFSVDEKDLSQKRSLSDINDSEGLLSPSIFIRMSQNVNLRKTPGGQKIKPILKDKVYQILGVHIKKNGRRYYKIKDDLDVGYFYAGTKKNYKKWSRQVWSVSDGEKIIALRGDRIKVKRRSGLSIFKGVELKEEITHVSRNKKLTVKDIIEGQDGQVIYFVKYKDKTGYVKVSDSHDLALLDQWNELN